MSSLQKALVEEKKSSLQSALAKEMGGGKRNRQRKSPPPVTTANESDSSDDDDSSSSSDGSDSDNEEMNPQMMNGTDMMKIRQQAIKLVNTPTAGPHAEAAKRRSGSNKAFVSPYQQQSAGEGPSGMPPGVASYQSSYQSSAPRSMHNPQSHPQARTADKLTMADMVVNCVSEVCKSSSSELISKVLSSGYRSVNNYENPPVSGSWGEIDTSSHGYGNNNRAPAFASKGGNMPARYQD